MAKPIFAKMAKLFAMSTLQVVGQEFFYKFDIVFPGLYMGTMATGGQGVRVKISGYTG